MCEYSVPYQNEPHMRGAKWYVDQIFYNHETITHEFNTEIEANKFINGEIK